MIDKLKQIEDKLLLDLLQNPNNWKSLMIDYHPPIVERLYAQIGNYRVLLHWIHKCSKEDALFHPHPWPSAMHVISGKYEMGLGFGSGLEEPPNMCTIVLENGGAYYDMTHVDGWHYVRPIEGVCVTTMLIGPKWEREEIKSDEPLKPMPEDRKKIMLEYFKAYYTKKNGAKKAEFLKDLKRGDWVTLEEKFMSSQEYIQIGKYAGKIAFVIKVENEMAHIRFKEGNDRIITHLKNLTLLNDNQKPIESKLNPEKEKVEPIKKDNPIGLIYEESELDEIDPNEDLDERNI